VERNAAILRLATASALSSIGSGAAAIALSAHVYQLTGSAVWLSGSFFLTFGISGLLYPLAGAVVDRFDRQRVMVTSDTLSTILWLLIIPIHSPTGLLAIGFVATVVHAPFRLASQAAIPVLAGSDDLNRANGTMGVAGNLGQIAGPAIGGLLYGWVGPGATFALNAASFACSAILISSITREFGEPRPEHGQRGMWKGLSHILADPATRSLFVVWVLLYLTVDVAIVADLPISQQFGWGTTGYGLISTVIGIGALIGSIFARRITLEFEPWAVLIGALGIAGGYLIVAAAPVFAFVLLGNLVWSLLDAGDTVAGTSIFQRRSPDHMRGRVFGAVGAGGLIANAIGFTFAGFLVETFGPKGTYALCGIASLLVTPLLAPMFRALRSDDAVPDP
jgi:MFS family permease